MGTHYSHLSASDRVFIEVFLHHGATQAAVARHLGCLRCTISRELRRTESLHRGRYLAVFGQRFSSLARRHAGRCRRKLGPDLDSPAWLHLRSGLAAGLSPQEIAGRLRLVHFCPGSHLRDPPAT